jgi:hypothetical protein
MSIIIGMNVNSISSKIVANIDFVSKLYKIIKEAGGDAIKEKRLTDMEDVVKINTKGITRFSPSRKTKDYKVEFNQNDMTIVGGEALNIYDYKLSEYKSNKGLNALEKYIKKSTSDIDIVWWPRVSTKNNGPITEIVTSRSEAIVHLATNFRKLLQAKLDENKELIVGSIKPYINRYTNSDIVNIDVAYNPYYALGTISLPVNITVKGSILKLCDISIHDSGASQLYDMDGNKLDTLKYMTDDPVYLTPIPGTANSILYLDVKGVDIAVPNIASFFNQQLFAFNNFVRAKNPKCLINYKRIEFLRLILNKAENNSNYTKLKEVFSTNNSDLLSKLEFDMDERLVQSTEKYGKELREICGNFKNNSNSIVKELCDKKIPINIEKKANLITIPQSVIEAREKEANEARKEAANRLAKEAEEYAKFVEKQKKLEKEKKDVEIQRKLQQFQKEFNKKQQKYKEYSYSSQGYPSQGYPSQGYPSQGYPSPQLYSPPYQGYPHQYSHRLPPAYPQQPQYYGKGRRNKTLKKYKLKENN